MSHTITRAGCVLVLASAVSAAQRATPKADLVYEASITELQAAMTAGKASSVGLVDAYLARIAAYDQAGPKLNAMIRLNPAARADAAALDAERRAGKVRGPLHGIPVILKDNYNTAGLATTGGSIALAGLVPATDAFQVRKLRDAGAVILGKANMHELASGIITVGSMGGQTCNPYDPDRYPGGSSGGSGVAVAASFAALAWGSDTCGSIRIPSAFNNLFGLRPTKGLSSIDGIIPLSHSQDVGGPLARTVMDLAIGLDATVGPDPADAATKILDGARVPRFVESLDTASLRDARIGVVTSLFGTGPEEQEVGRIVRAALDRMKARGAQIVEVTVPGLDSALQRVSVIEYELKPDLQDYLTRIPNAPVKSLAELLDRGLFHRLLEGGLRGREATGTRDSDAYRTALKRAADARALMVKFLDDNRLDAVAYPTMTRKPAPIGEVPQRGQTCTLSAVTGLPAISMPAGFTTDSLPLGLELLGRPLSDARLVAFASDYEQATHPRRAPATTPPLVNGRAPGPHAFTAAATANGVTVRGTFQVDVALRTLDYSVHVTGAPPAKIYAVSLDRDSAGVRPAMLYRLSGVGVASAKGSVKLGQAERALLARGFMHLKVYTADQPSGTARATLILPTLP
jgi:Asp-tRNA(Asn)/Glu-tRNA(Gln) amidotransferase A subunit family amidase